jgi:uncharacterized glyoxalase superfamily protein PhnB
MSTTGTLPVIPVVDVDAAIIEYVERFKFTEVMRVPGPDGTAIGQVQRDGNHVMFNRNPTDAVGRGGGIWLWIRVDGADVDAECAKLKEGGATIREELGNRFWGDRSFAVEDSRGVVLAFNRRL